MYALTRENPDGLLPVGRMIRRSLEEFLHHLHYLVPLSVAVVLFYEMTTVLVWSAARQWLGTSNSPVIAILEPPTVGVVRQLGWCSMIDNLPVPILVPAVLFLLGAISTIVYVVFVVVHRMLRIEDFDICRILGKRWSRRGSRRSRVFRNTYFFMTSGVNILFLIMFLALFCYMQETGVAIAVVVTLTIAPYVLVAVPTAVIERRGTIRSLGRSVQLASGNRLSLTVFTVFSSAVVFLLPLVVVYVATRVSWSNVFLAPDGSSEIIVGYIAEAMLAGLQMALSCVFAMTAYLELRRIEDRAHG